MLLILICLVTLLLMAFVTTVYSKTWNQRLTAEVFFATDQINEGERTQIRERIENRKMLPLPTLSVKFQIDRSFEYTDKENTSRTDKQYRTDCISVMPYQRVTRTFEVTGTQRGYYGIESFDMVAMDILYSKNLVTRCENSTWLYVYPSRSKYSGFQFVFNKMYGECLTNRLMQEDPFEFKGIRDYTPADPMRKINWKSSARTGELKVNQFYDTSSPQLTIFLNVSQNGVLRYDDLIEESIRVSRNFIEDFVVKGIPVTVISNGVDRITGQEVYLEDGAGLGHIDTCMRRLARLDTKAKVRSMDRVILEYAEKKNKNTDTVSLLISAEETGDLAQAYLSYVGKTGSAHWLVPIHESQEQFLAEYVGEHSGRGEFGQRIQTEYLIMEQMV